MLGTLYRVRILEWAKQKVSKQFGELSWSWARCWHEVRNSTTCYPESALAPTIPLLQCLSRIFLAVAVGCGVEIIRGPRVPHDNRIDSDWPSISNFNFPQDVIKLETQYWILVDIPRQEKQETVPAFVLRACAIMEKTHKSGEGVKTSARLAEEAENKRERIERLEGRFFFIGALPQCEKIQLIIHYPFIFLFFCYIPWISPLLFGSRQCSTTWITSRSFFMHFS